MRIYALNQVSSVCWNIYTPIIVTRLYYHAQDSGSHYILLKF